MLLPAGKQMARKLSLSDSNYNEQIYFLCAIIDYDTFFCSKRPNNAWSHGSTEDNVVSS